MFQEKLNKLIEKVSDDRDFLDIIYNCLISFEEYHKAVYELEVYKAVYGTLRAGDRSVSEIIEEMDKTRTRFHNSLLTNVGILNRMAGDEPIYDGIVSEERPHRREVANAVFKYMEAVINERS